MGTISLKSQRPGAILCAAVVYALGGPTGLAADTSAPGAQPAGGDAHRVHTLDVAHVEHALARREHRFAALRDHLRGSVAVALLGRQRRLRRQHRKSLADEHQQLAELVVSFRANDD